MSAPCCSIVRATEHVRSGRYVSPYRHILVDEFQDISRGRASLPKALLDQHANARLFAVGDDWQAIYRFAGSDVGIMQDFGATFGGSYAGESGIHRTVDLGRTFRCIDKIALPASRFVMKNPRQLAKRIVPADTADGKAIRIIHVRERRRGRGAADDSLAVEAGGDAKISEPAALCAAARPL